jgi:CRISPR/Cas system CSM-associated protein Csm3 (group 7 of RAMP superfamily)
MGERISWKLKMTPLTPLSIGGGQGEDPNMSYLLRDTKGNMFYPGSSLKGKIRHYAQLLYDQKYPDLHQTDELHQTDDLHKKDDVDKKCTCAVCRLFGREGNQQGTLFFSDMHMPDQSYAQSEIRAGVAIDRTRRTAKDEALYRIETLNVSELIGDITGSVENDDDIELLQKAIDFVEQIGGNNSRGLGWVEIKITDCTSKGDSISEDDIKSEDDNKSTVTDFTEIKADTVQLTLVPESPLLIGEHTSQSNYRDTKEIIPGTVIRAALARVICEADGVQKGEKGRYWIDSELEGKQSEFPTLRKAFEQISISTFKPFIPANQYNEEESSEINYIKNLPITAKKSKYKLPVDNPQEHYEYDSLVPILNEELFDYVPKHKGDEDYILENAKPEGLSSIVYTRAAKDRYRGTSKDGALYSVRAIVPEDNLVFVGTIKGTFDKSELQKLENKAIYVGGMQNTGFGKMSIKAVTEIPFEDKREDMKNRIEEFQSLIGDKLNVYVPITLMEEAPIELKHIDLNETSENYKEAYKEMMDKAFLKTQEKLPSYDIRLVLVKHKTWRGFKVSQPDIEGRSRLLLQSGGVFLLQFSKIALSDEDMDALYALEEHGICAERDELDGFGGIHIADMYHIEKGRIL